MTFKELFKQARGIKEDPFPVQCAFAESDDLPQLVNVPTGLGKTALAVLGWLWRRRYADVAIRDATPRRLVYCLPMRVLVEQTIGLCREWIANLNLDSGPEESILNTYTLLGGDFDNDWDLYPEQDAILVGTQDMLLSRALNRGYGTSRHRWPTQFGMLSNDCLWVFDEVQLMDVGGATSAQLEAFRTLFEASPSSRSIWMSATLQPGWLDTVDLNAKSLGDPLLITDKDKRQVAERYGAHKPLERASVEMGDAPAVARAIIGNHREESLTLAVFNTVSRACTVYEEIRKVGPQARVVLIHSRFRPDDRKQKMDLLLEDPPLAGTIAITTQVVEAGVDISAKTLFSELAPWASLVQRFGRCNRRGEFNKQADARVYWFDTNDEALAEIALPYEFEDLRQARKHLCQLKDASPASLEDVPAEMRLEAPHVIRRKDLVELFDTTPDLAGNDIDVSRWIRTGKELDVQVFWRDVPAGEAPERARADGGAPTREEVCSVPAHEFSGFMVESKKRGQIWRWEALNRVWVPATREDVYPGQTFLVQANVGGYDADVGWNPTSQEVVPEHCRSNEEPESYEQDYQSAAPWQSIAEHTDEVVQELQAMLQHLPLEDDVRRQLMAAARWHDRGKGHSVFQCAVRESLESDDGDGECRPAGFAGREDIAKAPRPFFGGYGRKYFRHELASALAMLAAEMDDLSTYLAAAHHGKVRLSIRSFPGEQPPQGDSVRLHARGIWDDDELLEVDIGGGVIAPSAILSLQCMQLGRSDNGERSWAERMLKLRNSHGPFRLAYFEALLRAADMRASLQGANGKQEKTS